MKITHIVTGATLVSLLVVSACTRQGASPDALVRACQTEVAPAGTYQYTEGTGLPVMVAVDDGTEAGAEAFNQCIRAKAVHFGLIPNPATSGYMSCPDGAPFMYGGASYCLGTK